MAKPNVYEIITDRIVSKLEEGTIPWRKPWTVYDDGLADRNLVSKKPYRGINAFITAIMPFDSPLWLTHKQATAKGGKVKTGEKSTPIVYWNWRTKEELAEAKANGEPMAPFFLRYYNVFNVEQCEGIEAPTLKPVELNEHERIELCEKMVAAMPKLPKVTEKGSRACYFTRKDEIHMPVLGAFDTPEEYYSTLFHELVHATGHESRVGRKEVKEATSFGTTDYSKEELVAECGAAFLCAKVGIDNTLDNSAAYIKNWLKQLKNDPRMVIMAAQQAQKAADFVLGEYKPYKKKEEVVQKKAA